MRLLRRRDRAAHESSQAKLYARLISTVPLNPPGRPVTPLERMIGTGLDARLSTDLSDLGNPQSPLITPNSRYYVRTAAPGTN